MVGSPEIGGLVRFGRWRNEDIEWRVLDAEPNRTLLITDKAISMQAPLQSPLFLPEQP